VRKAFHLRTCLKSIRFGLVGDGDGGSQKREGEIMGETEDGLAKIAAIGRVLGS